MKGGCYNTSQRNPKDHWGTLKTQTPKAEKPRQNRLTSNPCDLLNEAVQPITSNEIETSNKETHTGWFTVEF